MSFHVPGLVLRHIASQKIWHVVERPRNVPADKVALCGEGRTILIATAAAHVFYEPVVFTTAPQDRAPPKPTDYVTTTGPVHYNKNSPPANWDPYPPRIGDVLTKGHGSAGEYRVVEIITRKKTPGTFEVRTLVLPPTNEPRYRRISHDDLHNWRNLGNDYA